MLFKRYEGILRRAGLAHGRRDKFHKLRRTTASNFEAAGGNATDLLKHSARSVTLAYLAPTIVKPKQVADLVALPAGLEAALAGIGGPR